MTRRLARECRHLRGTSTGANVVASLRVAERLGPEVNRVTVVVDSGLRCLSAELYRCQRPRRCERGGLLASKISLVLGPKVPRHWLFWRTWRARQYMTCVTLRERVFPSRCAPRDAAYRRSMAIQDIYPTALRLLGRPVLVVGGGPVATRRAKGLLDAGARVTVVAPVASPRFSTWPVPACSPGSAPLRIRRRRRLVRPDCHWRSRRGRPGIGRRRGAARLVRQRFRP